MTLWLFIEHYKIMSQSRFQGHCTQPHTHNSIILNESKSKIQINMSVIYVHSCSHYKIFTKEQVNEDVNPFQ